MWHFAISSDVASAAAFSLTTFALGMTPLASQLASRHRSFVRLGASKASSGSVQALTQTGLGYVGITSSGLLLGFAAGYWAGLVHMRRLIVASLRVPSPHKWITRQTLRMCLGFSAASLVNSLVVAAIPLLMAAFYTSEAVGHYAIAQRIAVVPAGLVVAALTPVIAANVGTKLRAGDNIRPVLVTHMRSWAPLGAVVLLVPWLIPTGAIGAVLGEEWTPVAAYMRALSPLIASQVVMGPMTQVLMMTGHARSQLSWDVSRFVVVLCAASLVAFGGLPPLAMTGAVSIAVSAFYLWLTSLIWRATRAPLA